MVVEHWGGGLLEVLVSTCPPRPLLIQRSPAARSNEF